MRTFNEWINEEVYGNTNQLRGEPYFDVNWQGVSLTIRYLWNGYQLPQARIRGGSLPNEFASITLEQDRDHPEYLFVAGVGVDTPFRREGYATDLYREALKEAKSHGFKGLSSHQGSRTPDSNKMWDKFTKRTEGDFDFLEKI